MDTFLSGVLADLASRSVSFLVDRYYRHQNGVEENLQKLRRLLLRIETTVEEAEGRSVTNQAMLQQLQMLREAMYKGCYLFDTFKYRLLQQDKGNGQVGAHSSSALSKLVPAKRLPYNRARSRAFQVDGVNESELQKMLGSLQGVVEDMLEFTVFLSSYPAISRGPYSRYLFLEKCMFSRQTEMEKITSFLLQDLQPESPWAERLQVLPIIGPARVGKSTLVEHVCYDERVRAHFSLIILCSGDTSVAEGSGIVKHRSHGSHGRSLVIMELADDFVLDDRQCKRFYSSTSKMPPGSKVIITSRSEGILKLGTTRARSLNFLPQEAFWYFFKVLAFGSTNPKEHPELASIAIEISEEQDRSFIAANTIGGILRVNIRFWRKILELHRSNVQMHMLLFGEHPHKLLQKKQAAYIWSMPNISRLEV